MLWMGSGWVALAGLLTDAVGFALLAWDILPEYRANRMVRRLEASERYAADVPDGTVEPTDAEKPTVLDDIVAQAKGEKEKLNAHLRWLNSAMAVSLLDDVAEYLGRRSHPDIAPALSRGPFKKDVHAAAAAILHISTEVSQYNSRLALLDANGRGLFYKSKGVTGANDPGPGYLGRNASDWADVTALYFDILDENGQDISDQLDLLVSGDILMVQFETFQAGTNAIRLQAGAGIFHPSATGTDKGANTINFGAVYDDNTLLTCPALAREFLERGEIDLDFWDNLVPDQLEPEHRDEIPVEEDVEEDVETVELVPITTGNHKGKLRRTVRRERKVVRRQKVSRVEVLDDDGKVVGVRETPVVEEIIRPARIIKRQHRTARIFKAMIENGFDPRDPEQYFAKLHADEALPGMPTKSDWVHNALSTGEIVSQQWLAIEMLAIVANVMWSKLKDHEQRIASLEGQGA
jgi:hypothetical protein